MGSVAERIPNVAGGDTRSALSGVAESGLSSVGRLNLALALFRVVAGIVFAAHGGQKVFVYGLGGVSAAFGEMGIPLAGITGPLVAFTELLGGLALIAGAFTTIVGLALAAVMAGAMLLVHLPAGFFMPNGIEFTLTLFAGALALALTGPGRYSVDALRERKNG